MQEYVLDGDRMQDREAMHDELAARLPLPAYYGRNLDALWDVLTETDTPRVLCIKNPERMPGELFSSLAGLFLELCRTCPNTHFRIESDSIRAGLYRHFKGREYRVLQLALHSETLQPMVVYQAMYGDQGIWVRPALMWDQSVEREGTLTKRFTRIE